MIDLIVSHEQRIQRLKRHKIDVPIPTVPIRIESFGPRGHPGSLEKLKIQIGQFLGDAFSKKKKRSDAAWKARQTLGIPKEHLAVLSIDGGGVRGLIPLHLLERLEQTHRAKCYEIFDAILGTSTGAIIGSCIASGMTAAEIHQMYREKGHLIFPLSRDGGRSDGYAVTYELDLALLVEKDLEAMEAQWLARGFPLVGTLKLAAKTALEVAWRGRVAEIKEDFARDSLEAFSNDRRLRVIGGSPVYSKGYIRTLLQDTFTQRGCQTMHALARKQQCIVVFAAVDKDTGSSVMMSATGARRKKDQIFHIPHFWESSWEVPFEGSCEDAQTASCVEASMSAPLYFDAFEDALVDGGTLSTNMPLLGALIHLERRSQFKLELTFPLNLPAPIPGAAELADQLKPALGAENPAPVSGVTVYQPFNLHATSIFSDTLKPAS